MKTKTVEVKPDEITGEIGRLFDYDFDGTSSFTIPTISAADRNLYLDEDYAIGLIVGPSGSGKSSLLEEFGTEEKLDWNPDISVASHFNGVDDAIDRLGAVGFNSVPSWMRPYHVLSNGEQFRVDLARKLKDGAVIDEFTSVVDRNVAKSCAMALRKYVDKTGLKNLTFASCHYDIVDWLQPDWVYDTVTQEVLPRGSLQQPEIEVEMLPCSIDAWSMFSKHHYLTGEINKSARCWIAIWNDTPVGFASSIAQPNAMRNAWREHRTVVLPDFQGMGIGVRLSDALGEIHIQTNKRFFSKTAHPRMGEYREHSAKWRPTAHNKEARGDYMVRESALPNPRKSKKYSQEYLLKHSGRLCYAHEYIG